MQGCESINFVNLQNIPSGTYSSSQLTNSNNTVPSGKTVHFRSENSVELWGGFEVISGAIFTAEIELCEN